VYPTSKSKEIKGKSVSPREFPPFEPEEFPDVFAQAKQQ
jgi:hypothetical protein